MLTRFLIGSLYVVMVIVMVTWCHRSEVTALHLGIPVCIGAARQGDLGTKVVVEFELNCIYILAFVLPYNFMQFVSV